MPTPYNYLKLKHQNKPHKFHFLVEPEIDQVLDPNFSYAKFREDYIALRNGTKQGYFEDVDNIDVSILYTSDPKEKELFQVHFAPDEIDPAPEYYFNIQTLQQAYEDGLNAGEDPVALDKIISRKMQKEAQKRYKTEQSNLQKRARL